MPATVLSQIRVIDFSTGPVGGLATTVLADFGADVIKIEAPTGDRFRELAASPFWLRGKRSVALDLTIESDRSQALSLVNSADVVVVSGPLDRVASWGVDSATLRAANPDLIHCHISGWGLHGPYAQLPGYEGLVAAKSGRMAAFDVQLGADRPVFAAVPVASHVCSQAAVQGICASLVQRRRTGQGASVETSLLQALHPFDLVDLLARQISTRDGRSFTPLRHVSAMPTLNYHPLRTKDGGWIQCGNLLEHLFYSFLDATELLGEFLTEEQFQGSPATWTPESIEVARDRILLRMQERTTDEWMAIFAENGNVAAEPIVVTSDAIDHPDLVDGRGLIQIEDPVVGTTTQIAPIAELTGSPAVVGGPRPTVGDTDAESVQASGVDGDRSEGRPDEIGVGDLNPGRPLAGTTILDLSTIIAAPLGVSMLADLGAHVIKVEPFGGDPFRGLLIEGRMAVKTNLGKESICIDLKKAAGQAILHDLVRTADVLVHNFRGDVPKKLGIDFEQLAELNPDLIVAIINGYGPHGPGAKRPATHPVMGACTGGVALQAGEALTRDCPTLADVRENSRQIMAANEANPDPNTSVVAASAITLALVNRQRNGGGQLVRINMQVANAWANHDDFLSYDGKPARLGVDPDHRGFGPTYRLYQANDGWVFLATTTDDEFTRLCAAIDREDLATDDRFATAQARATHRDDLAEALTRVFADGSADDWESQLSAAGVGCVRADGIEADRFIASDPHIVENGWSPLVDHARFGRFRRWSPVVSVDGLNPDYRPAPLAGEHTDTILAGLGHSPDQILQLRADKVVNSEAP